MDVFLACDILLADVTESLVDRLLASYEGTHNYHNFTSGKKFSDMSSNRYIMSFKVGIQEIVFLIIFLCTCRLVTDLWDPECKVKTKEKWNLYL